MGQPVAAAGSRIVSGRDGVLRVVDGDTLVIGTVTLRLHGIDAPELAQSCSDMQGRDWSCGRWSKAVLERLAANGVDCAPIDIDRYERIVAKCQGADGDINAQMVQAGAAYAYEQYSKAYVAQEAEARRAGIGLWRGGAEDPAIYRAAKRAGAETSPPPSQSCTIKGNISKSGKIYHLPGGRWYEGTSINAPQGERWFCSEAEARAAGWRPAKG
ncbi:thermonuclease family protein [Celeribacter neptunius]|uniref:thermonuclease family protein n=1 Tax=Celeribacter neptunius TaxID=588602 RepID=UPI001FE69275|nr:thermonuclease family protein [Celeribacter neptunius]